MFSQLILMFSVAAAAMPTSPISLEVVHDDSDGSEQIWTNALLDGKPSRCIIDSGARKSAVREGSQFSGYPVVGKDSTTGISGDVVSVDLIRLRQIKLGGLHIEGRTVRRQKGLYTPCLIGNDILQAQPLFFDFGKKTLQAQTLTRKKSVQVLTRYGSKWSGFPVIVAGQKLDSLWDTGAGFTVVDSSIIDAHPDQFSFVREIPLSDPTGEHGKAKIYSMKSIRFGEHEVHDSPVISYSLSQIRKDSPTIRVVFGYNLISQFNWHIDNIKSRWTADKIKSE